MTPTSKGETVTARALIIVLSAAAAVAAVALVLLVSSLGSESSGHTMSDGMQMDGPAMSTHAMPGGESMSDMDMER